jgi:HPt (histidine-containing phosphotransfer) domain-containing protein
MSLLHRCLGNIKLVERVLAKFRETGSADLEQLEHALEQLDLPAVVEIAHRFKGAASNVSALGLYELAVQIERCGCDLNRAELSALLPQLRSEWKKFLRYSEAFVPTASASPGYPDR